MSVRRQGLLARPSRFSYAQLSTNPYVVYPVMVAIFLGFQLSMSYVFTGTLTFGLYTPAPRLRAFTADELARYNGDDPSLPLYLSMLGDVFDVSSGRQYYGPDGGYHVFAGRDATRAFITGCFTEEGATGDLRGLSEQQMESIKKWHSFYLEHKTYKLVGRLEFIQIPEDAPLPNDDCKSDA